MAGVPKHDVDRPQVATDSEADQLLELGGLKLAERLKGLHQDDLELQKSAKELMKMLQTRAGALVRCLQGDPHLQVLRGQQHGHGLG